MSEGIENFRKAKAEYDGTKSEASKIVAELERIGNAAQFNRGSLPCR
jgi:hypothetical protein